MSQDELKVLIARVKAGLKITKVVATRAVRGQRGDTFVGFSAAWNNVQEDGGQDLVKAGEDTDDADTVNGMTMQEAVIAVHLLAREADIAAYRNAAAGGSISLEHANDAVASIKSNYAKLILNAVNATGGAPDATPSK